MALHGTANRLPPMTVCARLDYSAADADCLAVRGWRLDSLRYHRPDASAPTGELNAGSSTQLDALLARIAVGFSCRLITLWGRSE